MPNDGQTADRNHGVAAQKETPQVERKSMHTQGTKMTGERYPDLQSAMRFPLRLHAQLKSGSGERSVETQNISANGVLFEMDSDMPIGSKVDFTLSLPADVVGADADVLVDCRGRVVRNFSAEGRRGVGVVIDEYRFERH
ncbi:MAG: PilZ domain-containing protein [Acidobacteria bacterium]|jgi:hypothetical protein|nr:PilZ domain-containing protein [Acidobacteriota bacterium]